MSMEQKFLCLGGFRLISLNAASERNYHATLNSLFDGLVGYKLS